jgi:hypothetical protein
MAEQFGVEPDELRAVSTVWVSLVLGRTRGQSRIDGDDGGRKGQSQCGTERRLCASNGAQLSVGVLDGMKWRPNSGRRCCGWPVLRFSVRGSGIRSLSHACLQKYAWSNYGK